MLMPSCSLCVSLAAWQQCCVLPCIWCSIDDHTLPTARRSNPCQPFCWLYWSFSCIHYTSYHQSIRSVWTKELDRILEVVCLESSPSPLMLNIEFVTRHIQPASIYRTLHDNTPVTMYMQLSAHPESVDQMQCAFFEDVVVLESAPVFKLLSRKNQSLLINWYPCKRLTGVRHCMRHCIMIRHLL